MTHCPHCGYCPTCGRHGKTSAPPAGEDTVTQPLPPAKESYEAGEHKAIPHTSFTLDALRKLPDDKLVNMLFPAEEDAQPEE